MSPIPQKITAHLNKRPMGVTELSEALTVSRQTIHKYIKILVAEGVIERQGEGAHVQYSISVQLDVESKVTESVAYFRDYILPGYIDTYGFSFEKKYNDFEAYFANPHIMHDFSFMLDSSVLYSSKIEGNTLDLSSYLNSKQLQKRDRPKEAQEVDDLAYAYEHAKEWLLTENNVLKLHARVGRSFVSDARRGVYRKEPVGVFSLRGIEYLAVESTHVQKEMHLFFNTITSLCKRKMTMTEALLWGSWVHLMFVLIHPFSDGNGRTARLLEKWFLAQHLGDIFFYIPTEEWYFTHRDEYYAALKLGVNYWEVDFSRASIFTALLPVIFDTFNYDQSKHIHKARKKS